MENSLQCDIVESPQFDPQANEVCIQELDEDSNQFRNGFRRQTFGVINNSPDCQNAKAEESKLESPVNLRVKLKQKTSIESKRGLFDIKEHYLGASANESGGEDEWEYWDQNSPEQSSPEFGREREWNSEEVRGEG